MNFFFNGHPINMEDIANLKRPQREADNTGETIFFVQNGVLTIDGKDVVKEVRNEDEWPEGILEGFEITRQKGPLVTTTRLTDDHVYSAFYRKRKPSGST